ncbi:fumarate hydratase [Anaerobium acetethylicum]|uniref:Fumarate hydratase subunit alpha n=1 Tax=Anaerobium acetethylicum TaxID=1619234 RepID=A0A1D3TST1_9FIRM|nr:fumarate hydratase [Anaerobium acetethylicum]SCP96964.1 fumarate hydratase subunit alpha [Anaerobium acetethylicum]
MTRNMDTSEVIEVIADLCKKACYELNDNLIDALKKAYTQEESPYGKDTLDLLIKNAEYAKQEQIACCHDTGTAVVIMEIGQEISWSGMPLVEAVYAGVRKGYEEGYLRKSMVRDPLDRVNTGDNTPCVFHPEIVPGDKVHITVMPKGGGSENMGAFTTLVPAVGEEGVKDFIMKTVEYAGGMTCPPIIVGVGVGGTMDKCAWLAKKALLRPIGERNPVPHYARMEEELLEKINDLGIGPLGMGGRTTALDVHIEYFPCHITALPVAVNLQCHASRHASAEI